MDQLFQFKPRHYLHFDLPISERSAEFLVCSPERVAAHSFYPFLGYTVETKRIRRNEQGAIEIRQPKLRDIKIASHRDAAIYAYYSALLSPFYEAAIGESDLMNVVTAFRRLRGGGTNVKFAGEVFRYIDLNRPCVALAFDVEKFFDTLDHDILKGAWCRLLGVERLPDDHYAVYRSLTRFCWAMRDEVYGRFGISRHNPKAMCRRRICGPAGFREQVRDRGLLRFKSYAGKRNSSGVPDQCIALKCLHVGF